MNPILILLVSIIHIYAVSSFRITWLPGYAPPPVGDRFDDPYAMLTRTPFRNMIGFLLLNNDGTRLSPDAHPWVLDGYYKWNFLKDSCYPRWCGDRFFRNYMKSLTLVSRSHSKEVLEAQYASKILEDSWKGRVCYNQQIGIKTEYRYTLEDPSFSTEICLSSVMGAMSTVSRNGFNIWSGIAYESSFKGKRFFDFRNKGSDPYDKYKTKVVSPYFRILDDSYRPYKIDFTGSTTRVPSNHPFSLQMTIVNRQLNPISLSQYANMEAMISISSVNKTFTNRYGSLYLQTATAILDGDHVSTMWNQERVIFVRFVNGTAKTTLRILDAHPQVDLNITLKRYHFNYKPFPDNAVQLTEKIELDSKTFTYGYSNRMMLQTSSSILKIEVEKQTPFKLRILPGYKINKDQTLNFPIEPPLQVELVDSKGYRIKSGEYSNLPVYVVPESTYIELSQEKTFNLSKGVGTFRGSIVKRISHATLRFSTVIPNGHRLETKRTDSFHVTNRYIGYLYDNSRDKDYFTGLDNSRYVTYQRYLTAVMGGMMENALLYTNYDDSYGEKMVVLNRKNGIGNADELRDIVENHQNRYSYKIRGVGRQIGIKWYPALPFSQAPKIKYVALIGSDDSNTEALAATAAAYGMVTVSDASVKDKFRDKRKYPMLLRLAYSEEYRFTLISNFLKSRNWVYVVVITGRRQAIPASLTEKLIHFNIKYYNIIFPSTLIQNGTLQAPSNHDENDFFQQIEKSHIKVIMNLLEGDELNYMVDAYAERQSTAGYSWIVDGDILARNGPLYGANQIKKKMKRLKAFDKALYFESYYEDFNLEHDAFKRIYNENDKMFNINDNKERNKYFMMYDASCVLRDAIIRAQIEKITITSENLLRMMEQYGKKTSVRNIGSNEEDLIEKNILGYGMKFDENYDRTNYSALLYQIDADYPFNFLKTKRLIQLGETVTVQNVATDNTLKEIVIDNEEIKYGRSNHSLEIKIKSENLEIIDGSFQPKRGDKYTRIERPPLSFYCASGCGGEKINTTHWQNGHCTWNLGSKCKCNKGYSETSDCSLAICHGCRHDQGTCSSPNICVCNDGYKHSNDSIKDCAVFHCDTNGCVNGNCTSGDRCTCAPNFYGKKCDRECKCKNRGICDDTSSGTGTCDCHGTGYFGSECTNHKLTIASISVLIILSIIATSIYLLKLKMKQVTNHQALMSTDWKAGWDEITMKQANEKSSMKSMMSTMSMMSAESEITKVTTKTFCQNQGEWNGRKIVVKMIRKDDMELTTELRKEIKIVREMHHANLCLFIGACLEAPCVCILNEVCGKGSLDDILTNNDINVAWDFRYSMLKDICRGMKYLANSKLGSHGRLKSSNCLIDNRWCVKLSDFGLKNFKANQYGVREFSLETNTGVHKPDISELEKCDYYNLLWSAPEIIATGVSHPNHLGYGTQAADIYSFAIIMVEMCTRKDPFHEVSLLRSDEIVQMIGRLIEICPNVKTVECRDIDGIPIQVLRPQVTEDDLPENIDQAEGILALIETCWNQDPKCRPDFRICMKYLNRISPHHGELMDNLIILMEQYTRSLEVIVADRTANIQEEKDKTDILLSKMLPPLIAEELKCGRNPQPEYFNSVTIYFSDVVGFGVICSHASPFEVVDILNGLYSVMDNVIDSFDCYKVETIGDCYVVVSGLPTRNGNRHAGEIARMSLELLQAFNGVSYVGYQNKQVQLRIGINSGPIVAGVVGIKMPRYCLFGDTMNTASRMESGGFALKIHMTSDTYDILEKLGGYIVECRGEIPVKGRGTMTTYWLKGMEGVHYNLPTEDMALSASQHHFK